MQWDFQNQKKSRAGLVRVPLVWKSHYIICFPAKFILSHVTGLCKWPIKSNNVCDIPDWYYGWLVCLCLIN